MNVKLFLFLLFWLMPAYSYEFYGHHFIASYKECDSTALLDINTLYKVFKKSVKTSGATILKTSHTIFENRGITIICLVAESHASIHTYPEYNACFIDLFTCGSHCSYTAFDETLRAYLKPKEIKKYIFNRS